MFWHSLLAKCVSLTTRTVQQPTQATGHRAGEGAYSCRVWPTLLHWAVSRTAVASPGRWGDVSTTTHAYGSVSVHRPTYPVVPIVNVTRYASFPAVVPASVLTVPLAAWARAPSCLLSPTPAAPRALDGNRGNRHTHLSYSKQSPPHHSSAFLRHTLAIVLTTHSQCLTLLPFTMRGATRAHSCLLTRQTSLRYVYPVTCFLRYWPNNYVLDCARCKITEHRLCVRLGRMLRVSHRRRDIQTSKIAIFRAHVILRASQQNPSAHAQSVAGVQWQRM